MGRRQMEILAMAALWGFYLWAVTVSGWGGEAVASVVGYEPADLASEERLGSLFERWMRRHGKAYGKEGERERRFRAFRENLAYIDRRNREKRGHSQRVGLNRFADLTNEEFRAIYTRTIIKPAKRWGENSWRRRELMASCDSPASLDWRKKGIVTPVKDQGDCGSCWAFSSTGAMEGIIALVTGELISLSEQELVDCDTTNYGCEGGYMDYAFEWVIQNGGIDTEADYSYTSVFGQSGTCNVTKEERKVVSIDGYEDVSEDESALLCAVVGQPVSVGIDGSAMDFQLYTGGIYDGDCSDNPDDIDHAVLVVGYGSQDGEDYWIVKNSWGISWGDNGYVYMKRNTGLEYGLCAINAMASYPTKEGSAAPSPYPSPAAPPPPSVPPPPPPPPSPPPPPPPSPSPEQCGDGSYCNPGETCCCLFEFADICFIYGCCEYDNAVCCEDSDYCCPHDYPICDTIDGLCLQNAGDFLGVKMKKRRIAKRKFPWTKFESKRKEADQPRELTWRGEGLAAV